MSISLAVSAVIFGLIALREWLPGWLKIWHIMTAGAAFLLATGQISPAHAFAAIDWGVILYLFSVFSIGTALFQNGLSHRLGGRLASIQTFRGSFAAFLVAAAIVAALLTNDAAAIIGTPIAFVLARHTGGDVKKYLIGLCVAVTIGSMATPIGNPQNLLIAASGGVPAPVFTFFLWLIVPTVLGLGGAIWWLARGAGQSLPHNSAADVDLAAPQKGTPEDERIWPSYVSLVILIVLVVGDSLLSALDPEHAIPLGWAGLIACLPVFIFDDKRLKIAKEVDWPTLVFFVAMFIVTGALIESHALQRMLGELQGHLDEPLVTAAVSFLASQAFSNVPVVDMYLKLLDSYSVANLMMLSAVSTLAGNVFIISAASNVIVVQQAERFGVVPFTFREFTKAVLPIAAISLALAIGWIVFLAWAIG
ncbi:MAG: SLC13 family permease [Pseudomonadota bacterium]